MKKSKQLKTGGEVQAVAALNAAAGKFSGPLPAMLDTAVSLHILEYRQRGGPDEADWAELPNIQTALSSAGEAIFHRVPGKTAEGFNALARAIAFLSFCPGGVRAFGRQWDGCKGMEKVRQPARSRPTGNW